MLTILIPNFIIHGICYIAILLLLPRTLEFVITNILRSSRRIDLKANKDSYAVITGSSDGIGLEYARQLAKRGFNLLLISRTESKLKKIQDELQKKYKNDVQILSVDFTKIDIYDDIATKVSSLPQKIGVLVNNVGMARRDQTAYKFAEFNDNINQQILICNNYSMTRMCEIVLPVMEKQGSGVVINISSLLGSALLPYVTAYSASKAWVNTFSECISREYPEITFQNVEPSFVTTNIAPEFEQYAKESGGGVFAVQADEFVEQALLRVGEQLATAGHPRHMLLRSIVRLGTFVLPASYYTLITEFLTARIRDRMKEKKQ